MMLQAIIFTTGGAILALELLASRIMTPYFGVSLFIWSGILSITLVSLALGYWWGGRLAAGRNGHALPAEKLASLFTLMPAVAAIAIVIACLAYPYLFYQLARIDLVVGAFCWTEMNFCSHACSSTGTEVSSPICPRTCALWTRI